MQYLLLVYGGEGPLDDGGELQASTSATTVRIRGGQEQLTDGPFGETEEPLRGYCLVEGDSIEAALERAARIAAAGGAVEVRPAFVEGAS